MLNFSNFPSNLSQTPFRQKKKESRNKTQPQERVMRSTAARSSSPSFLHSLFFSTTDLFIAGTLKPKSKNRLALSKLFLLTLLMKFSLSVVLILFLKFPDSPFLFLIVWWSRGRLLLVLFLIFLLSSCLIPRAACLFFLLLIPHALHNDCIKRTKLDQTREHKVISSS